MEPHGHRDRAGDAMTGDVEMPEYFPLAHAASRLLEGYRGEDLVDALAAVLWLCLDARAFATPEVRRQALDQVRAQALGLMETWEKRAEIWDAAHPGGSPAT